MFRANRIRSSDPFRLSTLGRCRAVVAWLRGPALMRRWLLLLLSFATISCWAGVLLVLLVMQPASPGETMMERGPEDNLAASFRVGPSSSKVVELPGYECHPMPTLGLKYLNPMRTGPSVVAIGKDGVVWGPTCVVDYGLAGS